MISMDVFVNERQAASLSLANLSAHVMMLTMPVRGQALKHH